MKNLYSSNGQTTALARLFMGVGTLLLCNLSGYAQALKGYSAQTQPSVVYRTQYLSGAQLDSIAQKKYRVGANKNTPAKALNVQAESNKAAVVPTTSIAIDDNVRLLTIYDNSEAKAESQRGLGHWRVGVVSDGDFNKTLTSTDAPSPKAGSLGIDAVFMKAVYYKYTYTGTDLQTLEGYQTVLRPSFSINTLAIIFGQGIPLSTGIDAGSTTQATLDARRAFGQVLLVPGAQAQGGLSFAVTGSWFPWTLGSRQSALPNLSIDYALNLTQTNWSTRGVATAVNIVAPNVGIGYRIVDTFIDRGQDEANVQLRLFARYTMRHLFGDVEYHPQLLLDALDTENRTFHGLDLGITTSVNALRLTVNVPIFFGPRRVEGFTNGQVVLGLGLAAAIPLIK